MVNNYVNIMADLYIGVLSSGRNFHDKKSSQEHDISFIVEFEKVLGFKILLSQHSEYYEPFLKDKDIELIIYSHAHDGQVRIGNQGLYSPGQGLFPKYTSGI